MLIGISVPCENLQKQELHVSIVTIVQIQITDEPSRRTALVHGRGAAYVAPVRLTSALLSFMLPFSVPGKVAVVLCVLLRSVYTLETKVAAGNTSSQHSKWQVEHCWGSQLTSLHVEATQRHHGNRPSENNADQPFRLLILSIVKDSHSWGKDRDFQDYLSLLQNVTSETANLQLALGLSFADEHTFYGAGCSLAEHTNDTRLEKFCSKHSPVKARAAGHSMHKLKLQRVTLVHAAQDALLAGLTDKTKRDPEKQMLRRRSLATLRNQLLFRALKHEDAVLWIDADIVAAPADMVPAMIASNKDIVTPLCVFPRTSWWRQELAYFDYNVFQGTPDRPSHSDLTKIADGALFPQRDKQTRYGNITYLDELHAENPSQEFVELSSVGGTMLWVRADVHRDGVVFPVANVVGAEWTRQGYLGLETEGICWMANFLGYKCWGMPWLTIMHSSL